MAEAIFRQRGAIPGPLKYRILLAVLAILRRKPPGGFDFAPRALGYYPTVHRIWRGGNCPVVRALPDSTSNLKGRISPGISVCVERRLAF